MRRSPASRQRGFALIRENDIPLHRQVCEQIRTGQPRPGDRLPSTRVMADRCRTARGTMDAAYAIFAGEGYLVGRVRRS
jgi:GntR family transcriptional regulator/MocR family aminotransferase